MGQQHIRRKLKLSSGMVWYPWYLFLIIVLLYQYPNAILTPSNSYFFRSVASRRGDLDLQIDQDKDEKRKLEQKLLSFTNSHLGTSFHTLENHLILPTIYIS